MSVNERIQEIIDKKFLGNKSAFSKKVGISRTGTENIVGTRQTKPSYKIIEKIILAFDDISAEWLMRGEGDMLLVTENEVTPEHRSEVDIAADDQMYYGNPPFPAKPFIDSSIPATSDFETALSSKNSISLSIPFSSDYDFSIRHYGDSMINNDKEGISIENFAIVLCKFWKNKSFIRWGAIYALITVDGYIIKKIVPADSDDKVRCVSFNEEKGYKPYDLPVSEILDWAIVVGVNTLKMI